MSLFNELVTGGTDCLGTNPLTGLKRQLEQSSALTRRGDPHVRAAESSAAAASRHQNAITDAEEASALLGQQHVDTFDLRNIGTALQEQERHHEWAEDYLGFSRHPPSPHPPQRVVDGQHSRAFDLAFNRAMTGGALNWSSEYAKFQQATGRVPLNPAERTVFSRAFETVELKPSDRDAVDGWIRDFAETQEQVPSIASDPYALQVAADVAQIMQSSTNDKFRNSKFASFMNAVSMEHQAEASSERWSQEFHQGKNADKPGIWSEEFAKRMERSWAEEFSQFEGKALSKDGKEIVEKYAGMFEGLREREEMLKDWVSQYRNGTKDADSLDSEWKAMQDSWKEQDRYHGVTPHTRYEFEQENPFMTARKEEIAHVLENQSQYSLAESILALEASIQADQADARKWTRLGILQQENERDSQAIAALKAALDTDQTFLDAFIPLAVSYTNESLREDAYDNLERWIQQHPSYHRVLDHVRKVAGKSRHEFLCEAYTEAARMSPNEGLDANVQIGLGVLFNVSEEYTKAVDCFEAALSKQPTDHVLWNKLGATLANSQKASRAIETYYEALRLNPSYVRARYNLAISFINMGQYREAAEHLLKALGLQQQPNQAQTTAQNYAFRGASGFASSSVWQTLKMTTLLMDRHDLAAKCDSQQYEDLLADFFGSITTPKPREI